MSPASAEGRRTPSSAHLGRRDVMPMPTLIVSGNPCPAPRRRRLALVARGLVTAGLIVSAALPARADAKATFQVEEATIADIHKAILAHELTVTDLVKLYLARIKAYNGPAVEQPYGILGPITTIPHAKG